MGKEGLISTCHVSRTMIFVSAVQYDPQVGKRLERRQQAVWVHGFYEDSNLETRIRFLSDIGSIDLEMIGLRSLKSMCKSE
jgi:hypothetical protein